MACRISPYDAEAAEGRAENMRSWPGFTCIRLARTTSRIRRLVRFRTVALPTRLFTENPTRSPSEPRLET